MAEISQMINALIIREGGFVNDPDDPGGATKYGITIGTLSAYRGRKSSVSQVKALTKAEATQIYADKYYHAPRIDELPDALQPSVFDMYVNAGRSGVKILQSTLNKFGDEMGVSLLVDGVIGPKTIKRAQWVYDNAAQYLVDAYGIERREYYYRLADGRKASRKYAMTRTGDKGGWIKRAEEFISAKYKYSDADHKARTANWR